MRRFQREARLTASLDHPKVARLKNAEFIDDLLVATYPLGRESLADRLTRRLGTSKALSIACDLLEALAYAHQRGVIHLDVKPENILLFPHGPARLADFGLSKIAAKATCSGSGLGTVGYYAPEQAFGRPSRRSDVFSAGLVIWRLLSGILPTWPLRVATCWPDQGRAKSRTRDRPRPAQVDAARREEALRGRRRDARVVQPGAAAPRQASRRERNALGRRRRQGKLSYVMVSTHRWNCESSSS